MPAKLNPVRKALVKQSLLKGNSIRQALKDAGYAPGQQRGHNNATTNTVVKSCQEEIKEDVKKLLSIEWVLEKLKNLALESKNESDRIRSLELIGKWKAMFIDKADISQTVVIKAEEKEELSRIRGELLSINN
jgi:hypothetical protein